jgi:hypothetical protein
MVSNEKIYITFKSVMIMAKPIRATPTLRGQDAVRFIRNMIKEEVRPNPKRVAFIKKALNTRFNVIN